jgi:hypothetical protein
MARQRVVGDVLGQDENRYAVVMVTRPAAGVFTGP